MPSTPLVEATPVFLGRPTFMLVSGHRRRAELRCEGMPRRDALGGLLVKLGGLGGRPPPLGQRSNDQNRFERRLPNPHSVADA